MPPLLRTSLPLLCFLCALLSFNSAADDTVQVVTELSPPNQILINDNIGGSSTDIVRHVLSEANVDADINIYPWARAFYLAKKQANTLIYSLAKTPEREPLFHWLGKVAYFRLGFVSLSSSKHINIKQLEDARAYRIAVQRDDISALFFVKRGFTVLQTTDIKHSYRLLLSGKVDLIIDDPNYVGAMAQQFNLPASHLRFISAIEELSVYGYLAANKDMDATTVANIKEAFAAIEDTTWYQQKLRNPYHELQTFND
ncbi:MULTISPECIES: substrate-binding periplasmic protein [unclassified Pseudoalteromonas]|uniref:substrate-binding periplasmic protein n=1 Tax=unclassified Pseudoalteromonas TaxID=194690 RepID=UPI000CF6DB28|nr:MULTISPECIES: transporter substrate-binding domain-containing protein [unclassified Pseudoalteromonas]